MIKVFCDGGSRGNPGKSAGAFVVEVDGKIVYKGSKYLGVQTNNVAEYGALVLALSWLKQNIEKVGSSEANIFFDSELVAKQMSGLFKIKNENLRSYFLQAKAIEKDLGIKITYFSVSREKNKLADFLVNKCLDENS